MTHRHTVSFAFLINSAVAVRGVTLHVEFSAIGIGSLNLECAVRPSLSSVAAMPELATANATSFACRTDASRQFSRYVFIQEVKPATFRGYRCTHRVEHLSLVVVQPRFVGGEVVGGVRVSLIARTSSSGTKLSGDGRLKSAKQRS